MKENFCPLCIAPVVALAGAGATGAGIVTDEEKNKKKKKILIISGLVTIIFTILFLLWMKYKKCNTCR